MKVIIAGSRTLNPTSAMISKIVKDSGFDITQLVTGGADGVDACGELYCLDRGIPTTGSEYYISEWVWDVLGKKAGPLRNKAMAEYADAAIVIWDGQSKGSCSMIEEMKKLGKSVYEVILSSRTVGNNLYK